MRISIVIPTRDRAAYLRYSLATATAIADPDVEIVVSDNASVDETAQVVENAKDPRIKYVNTGSRVSMRQNFEFALKQSTGDYVIFFGDDDGILAGQFPMLCRILEEQRPDGLSWDFPVYGWPTAGHQGRLGGLRIVKRRLFGGPQMLDVNDRRRAAEGGRMDKQHPMPAIYHGCVSRSFLDQISHADGTCFLARSPDTYINYRTIQHGGTFLHCAHPFSINGYSPASTGGGIAAQGSAADPKPTKSKFETELETDPIDDVIPLSKSMALGFLGTLETVRSHFPTPPLHPDYTSWYVSCLDNMRGKNEKIRAEIFASLRQHAVKFDALPALEAAQKPWRHRLRKLSVTWEKNLAKVSSFRIKTARGGENTILTAAQTCDALLGVDYDLVLNGELGARSGWANVKSRGKSLANQS